MTYNNFNIEKERAAQDGSEWLFGSQSPSSLYEIPLAERENYLPMGEIQRGSEDFADCASRGPVNYLAAEFSYAYKNGLMKPESKRWLEANGYVQDGRVDFSDRYIAINSGTTRQGNSLKAPLEAIRANGLIPKPMLPAEKWMNFATYIDPTSITQQMRDLGAEFSRRFQINYEQVSNGNFAKALEKSCLDVAVYAWPFPENGEYKRDDRPFNHVVLMFALPAYFVFDNYVEVGTTDDFIKKLSSDYAFFDWGYRVYVSAEVTPEERADTVTVFNVLSRFGLTRFFADFLALFTTRQAVKQRETAQVPLKPWQPTLVPPPAPTAPSDILPSDTTPNPESQVPIDGPKPAVSDYKWGTRAEIIHSIRVLCDEYGLSWAEKAEICATIEAESNFNTKAKLENKVSNGKVWSTDWGLCQINDHYHVGRGKAFASVEEILEYPERSVRFMLTCFEQGKIDLWVAHKNGSYKKFLKKYLTK